MGDEEVEVAVVFIIAHGKAHGSTVIGGEGGGPDVGKGSISHIPKDPIFRDIVGGVEVDPAVEVEIETGGAERAAFGIIDTCGDGDIGEGAIAIVAEESIGSGGVGGGVDGVGDFGAVLLCGSFGIGAAIGELDIVADIEVDPAVAVVIEPGAARAETEVLGSGGRGDIGEGAIGIVMEEGVFAVAGDVEVEGVVVVVIAPRGGHAVEGEIEAGGLGDIGEGAIAVILEEGALSFFTPGTFTPALPQRGRESIFIRVTFRGSDISFEVDDEEVGVAVVVVVAPGEAGAHVFGEEGVAGGGEVLEVDARCFGDFGEGETEQVFGDVAAEDGGETGDGAVGVGGGGIGMIDTDDCEPAEGDGPEGAGDSPFEHESMSFIERTPGHRPLL